MLWSCSTILALSLSQARNETSTPGTTIRPRSAAASYQKVCLIHLSLSKDYSHRFHNVKWSRLEGRRKGSSVQLRSRVGRLRLSSLAEYRTLSLRYLSVCATVGGSSWPPTRSTA